MNGINFLNITVFQIWEIFDILQFETIFTDIVSMKPYFKKQRIQVIQNDIGTNCLV